MNKKTVKLTTGKSVDIREMSLDEMDLCKDMVVIRYHDDDTYSTTGLSKAKTAWLRRGIVGGDFKGFKSGSDGFPIDSVLTQLSEDEGMELLNHIRGYQNVGEEKPSH
mgnify:CR=1 FL=1